MPQPLQSNPLVEEWKRSGSSLSYGGWLERELMAARQALLAYHIADGEKAREAQNA